MSTSSCSISFCIAESPNQLDLACRNANPMEIDRFIKNFGKRLKQNQIKLLKLMRKNIYGVFLYSHETYHGNSVVGLYSNEAVFKFNNEGVRGSITFLF